MRKTKPTRIRGDNRTARCTRTRDSGDGSRGLASATTVARPTRIRLKMSSLFRTDPVANPCLQKSRSARVCDCLGADAAGLADPNLHGPPRYLPRTRVSRSSAELRTTMMVSPKGQNSELRNETCILFRDRQSRLSGLSEVGG